MTAYYLGVDVGNTKSHALIADERGHIAGFGQGGPGNWEVYGWDGLRTILSEIVAQATAQAGVHPEQLAGAGFGIAGYDWPEDRQAHVQIIRSLLGPQVPIGLVNDAFIGLWASTDIGWGVVVSAGTSCNCYGRNAQGDVGRVTGSNYFGEYAGAGELVWWAIQAVARAWSLRGPATCLSEAFLDLTGATDVTDLLAGLARGRYQLGSQHAPAVFELAAQGDSVALKLVRRAGQGLADLALGVSRQLGITTMAFDVVLAGSFYRGSPLVEQVMAKTIQEEAPLARIVRLTAPPVVGAALLGMEMDGLSPAAVRHQLIESTNHHLRHQEAVVS